MTDFERALKFVLRHEGGYVNDPQDRGGATNYGITQAAYDEWSRAKGVASRPVQNITDVEVKAIYEERYWRPANCHEMCWPLNASVFDAAVQHGVQRAIKFLQKQLGVTQDGIIGPQTRRTFCKRDQRALAYALITDREAFYGQIVHDTPGMKKFAAGWDNRLVDLGPYLNDALWKELAAGGS